MFQEKETSVFLPATEKRPEKFYVLAFENPKAKYATPDKHLSPYAPGGVLRHVFLCLQILQGDPFRYLAYKVSLHTIFDSSIVAPNSQITTSFLC